MDFVTNTTSRYHSTHFTRGKFRKILLEKNNLIADFSVEAMKKRLGKDVVRVVGYGHIGDCNMHLNITGKAYSQEVMDKIEPYLYQWTSEHKGSISAEHGKTINGIL